jgi:hypothetical protein
LWRRNEHTKNWLFMPRFLCNLFLVSLLPVKLIRTFNKEGNKWLFWRNHGDTMN